MIDVHEGFRRLEERFVAWAKARPDIRAALDRATSGPVRQTAEQPRPGLSNRRLDHEGSSGNEATRMRNPLRMWVAGIFLAIALLVAACGSSERPPASAPTPAPTATPYTTSAPTPDPVQRERAQVCLIEAISQQELVDLASGKVPLISTLIEVRKCDAAIEDLGASFPLSVEQLECLKLYGGDDAFQAMAGGADVPQMLAEAMDRCEIDLGVLKGTTTTS